MGSSSSPVDAAHTGQLLRGGQGPSRCLGATRSAVRVGALGTCPCEAQQVPSLVSLCVPAPLEPRDTPGGMVRSVFWQKPSPQASQGLPRFQGPTVSVHSG